MQDIYSSQSTVSTSAASNKVLRNTYMLLSMTLAFSTLTAAVSMSIGLSSMAGLVMSLVAMAMIWFVLPRTANTAAGIWVVFAFTGLIGASLGPLLSRYLAMANGGQLIMQALGGTALIFAGLSAYVLTSKKDFSFMRGFVAAGMMVLLISVIFMLGASFFGYYFSTFHVILSAFVVLLMSAAILYQTSEIIHGGETNYIMATTSLYLSIVNLFTSLLHLLGVASDD
jgi:modulator of FtsH protease